MAIRHFMTALGAAIVLATTVLGSEVPVKEARAVDAFSKRSFIGGWALGGGFEGACPASTTECPNTHGACCPSTTTCTSEGNFGGVACCPPGGANCGTVIKSVPSCANSTWDLYYARGSYFCCQPGEKAVIENSGHIVLIVGVCVPGDQNVPTSALAKPISTATAAPSATTDTSNRSTITSMATTATTATTTTTAQATATSTPTGKSLGASTSVSLTGLLVALSYAVVHQLL